ncbi:MAG: hypothetical protein WBX17_13215, partial [Microbacterium sp.]
MTDIETADAQALADRIRELETENARLAAAAPAVKARPSGGRWRAPVSAICIVIASILVPVSIVTAWARVELVDEDAFVETLAPLVHDAAVRQLVIDETMDAVNANVDFQQLTGDLFDGISDLGLPPRAVQALGMLQGPAADGLENLVNEGVTRVVDSEAFADVWTTATRAAHRALTTAATSDGGGLVVRTDDGVGIQLGVIVETVKQRLVDRGVNAAELIPQVDRVVIVGEGDNLAAIRTVYALSNALGWWLPIISLALFGLGIALARRRSVAVLGAGLGLAIGAGTLAAALAAGTTGVQIAASELDLSPSALTVIYSQIVAAMSHTATILAVLGVVVAVLGWLAGRSAAARGVRGGVGALNSSVRRHLGARGLDTGGFGGWLARSRVVVRTVIAIVAILWLFALRPLSIGDIFLVLVVALVVLWILELLQRRDDERVDTAPDATPPDSDEIADPADVSAPKPLPTEVTTGTSPDAVTAVLPDTA